MHEALAWIYIFGKNFKLKKIALHHLTSKKCFSICMWIVIQVFNLVINAHVIICKCILHFEFFNNSNFINVKNQYLLKMCQVHKLYKVCWKHLKKNWMQNLKLFNACPFHNFANLQLHLQKPPIIANCDGVGIL
jgi:hypothetical protein